MKTFAFLPSVIIAIVLCLLSCSPKYYAPNYQDVPLLRNEGDFNLGVNGYTSLISVTGAYAIKDHYAFKGQGAFYFPPDNDQGDGGSGKFIEAGFGYYTALSEKILFEAYALFASGNMENHFSTITGGLATLDADVFRYGLQPAIGFSSKNFELAFSTRLAGIDYRRVRGNLLFNGVDQEDYLKENHLQFVAEPAITLKAGHKNLKITGQVGTSFNLAGDDFPQDNLYIGLGVEYQLKKWGWD